MSLRLNGGSLIELLMRQLRVLVVRFHRFFTLGAVTVLCACGGGGSSGSGSIAVTYSPESVTVGGVEGHHPNGIGFTVTATLSATPGGAVYPVIVSSDPVIQTGSTVAVKNADGSYTATLTTVPALGVGTYTGTLTLMLCKDPQCSSQYPVSGATLPFTITVIPEPQFTLTANQVSSGQATISAIPGSHYFIVDGSDLTLTTDTPVVWTMSTNGASLHQSTDTTTSISGAATKDLPVSGVFFSITAAPVEAPEYAIFKFTFQFY